MFKNSQLVILSYYRVYTIDYLFYARSRGLFYIKNSVLDIFKKK